LAGLPVVEAIAIADPAQRLADYDVDAQYREDLANELGVPVPWDDDSSSDDDEDDAAQRESDRLKRVESTMADMHAKAGLLWNTKDIKSQNDRAVVLTSLSNIARSTGMHDFYPGDVAALVQSIVDEERIKSLLRRTESGSSSQHDPYVPTLWKQVWARLCGRDGSREIWLAGLSDTPCRYLDRVESGEPYTFLDDESRIGTIARNFVTVTMGVLEEAGKIIAVSLLQRSLHHLIGLPPPGARGGRLRQFSPLLGIGSLVIVSGAVAGFECWRRGTMNVRAFSLRTIGHALLTGSYIGGADGGPTSLRAMPEQTYHESLSWKIYRQGERYAMDPPDTAVTTVRARGLVSVFGLHIGWNLFCGKYLSNRYALNVTHCKADFDGVLDAPVTQDVCVQGLVKLPPVLPTMLNSKGRPTDEVAYGYCRVRWHVDEECIAKFGTRDFGSVSGFRATVFRACSHCERAAISGRVIKALPTLAQPEEDISDEWARLTDMVLASFDKITNVRTGINFEEWVSSMPRSKRDMYRKLRTGIVELKLSKRPTVRYEASCFIKREKAVKRVFDFITVAKTDPAVAMGIEGLKDPRYIQAAVPVFTYKTVRFVRSFAKNLRKAFLPNAYDSADLLAGRHFVYTCGMSNVGIGKAYGDCLRMVAGTLLPGERIVVLEDDQSRFDMHMGASTFKFLYDVYDRKLPPRVAVMLRRGRHHDGSTPTNFGRSRLRTKHATVPAMQSGWSDTSAGDTAANMAMKLYIHGERKRWVSIVCGDDSVTVMVDSDLAALGWTNGIVKRYFRLGMEVEAIASYDPLDAGFCSARFMAVGDTFLLVPKTGKLLARMLCDTVDRAPRRRVEWIQGIANGLRQYNWDPILLAYADGIDRQVGVGDTVLDDNPYKIQYVKSQPVTWVESLSYIDKHYGLNEKQTLDVCSFLRTRFALGVPIRHVLIEDMVERDL
jgi:hypothetical protein